MSLTRLALLGGEPAFASGLPFVQPARPPLERVMARLQPSYDRGMLTNGPLVRQLEDEVAARLGVAHVAAVSSCTVGLMLTIQALTRAGDSVLMPSFTFAATAHAAAWAGGKPRFAECRTDDFMIDVDDAAQRLDGSAAVIGTHVFGAPCHPERVEALAAARGIPVVFDAAHALGTVRGQRPVGGFGAAEVFSLSPTKVVVGGEGGLVTTNDGALADVIRIGRDYGNPGTYDSVFAGLNGRLSELHAAMALESLRDLDEHLARRRRLVARYGAGLAALPGVGVQHLEPDDESTHKDFTIVVDDAAFGVDRDTLAAALRAEGIDTRCYFSPPVHRHTAYRSVSEDDLPRTDWLAARVISLPLWRDLAPETVEAIADAVARVHHHAEEINERGRAACVSS
jgi:dTDP-4-amino-4,6-dideoxygalactose transaminase